MTNINSAIERIRIRFVERLKAQEKDFQAWAAEAKQGPKREEAYEKLCAGAHKVAGLAKSVGYEDLGKKAFDLDSAIQKMGGATDAPDPRVEALLNEFLEEYVRVIAD